jgi:GAF domain-containing protein
LRFYAAAPLLTPEGFAVGMLGVCDRTPRELSPPQLDGLRALARQVMAQIELKRRRRSEKELSSEKLMLEAAGLSDRVREEKIQ